LNDPADTPPKRRPRKWLRIGGLGRVFQKLQTNASSRFRLFRLSRSGLLNNRQDTEDADADESRKPENPKVRKCRSCESIIFLAFFGVSGFRDRTCLGDLGVLPVETMSA